MADVVSISCATSRQQEHLSRKSECWGALTPKTTLQSILVTQQLEMKFTQGRDDGPLWNVN